MRFEALNICKSFGGLTAVDNVSLTLDEGTILGIIGPNGAGKSTLFNCMSGFEVYDSGSVMIDRSEIHAGDIPGFLKAGIARTFQNTSLFDGMTVRQNLEVAACNDQGKKFFSTIFHSLKKGSEQEEAEELVEGLLRKFDLADLADKRCESLGSGHRRIVEVVRSCALNPSIVFLDEPAAGLNPTETNELMEIIRRIRNLNISVIVVEHDLKLIMELCDNVIVLDRGQKIAEGPPHIVQKDPAVIASYLGTKN